MAAEVPMRVLALWVVLSASAGGIAAGEPPPSDSASEAAPNHCVLLQSDDAEYTGLKIPQERRTAPEATRRLVVFSAGEPVLDVGLRDEKSITSVAGSTANGQIEEGVEDGAVISRDGRSAIVLVTRYRRPVPRSNETGQEIAARTEGASELYWIDAAHPAERWRLGLGQGRWVSQAVALDSGRGIAVSTTGGVNEATDLRIFGAGGREIERIREEEASTSNIVLSGNGRYLAADISFRSGPNLPDRGVRVFDLEAKASWTYTWSYGHENEPVEWSLRDDGHLEVKTPEGTFLYDTTGKPAGAQLRLGSSRKQPSGR
jgi:hypothetical protein